MKTIITVPIIGLLFSLPALAQYSDPQLTDDIEKVARTVAADERGYVTNYLHTGPSGLAGGDFLTAAMARNALNKVALDQNVMGPLARTMHRHAQGTNFPADTRQYGLARLTTIAGRNQEAEVLARSLGQEIVKREQDPLKRAAERFLRESSQPLLQSAPKFTAKQLVGRWRHVNVGHKLATTLNFNEDDTYTGSVEVNGKVNGSFSGKWTVNDGRLNYEYTASSDKNIPAGSKDQDKIVEITRDRYTIENTLGLRETYVRVK